MMITNKFAGNSQMNQFLRTGNGWMVATAGVVAIALSACNNITTDDYQATATVTYAWRVEYAPSPVSSKSSRFETFNATSLENINGQKPEWAVIQDDKGLWWPMVPPRPSLDEIEQQQTEYEKANPPELMRNVEYTVTYRVGSSSKSLPTNYSVYRQVAKAYPERTPLRFVLGLNDASVEKAEPF